MKTGRSFDEEPMPSRSDDTNQQTTNADDAALYMVLKVANGELQELSSQIHPGSSAQLYAITSRHSQLEGSVGHGTGLNGLRRNIFRHPKPCGGCSATKSRCIPLPSSPMLCVRCKAKKLTQCPPHVPWAQRRARGEHRVSSKDSPKMPTQSSPLPEETRLFVPQPPSPMMIYSAPYAMQIGTQAPRQYGDAVITQAPSQIHYMPTIPEENLPQFFHASDTGVSGEDYLQMQPYPSFSPGPGAASGQPLTHVPFDPSQPQMRNDYQETCGQYQNPFWPSSSSS